MNITVNLNINAPELSEAIQALAKALSSTTSSISRYTLNEASSSQNITSDLPLEKPEPASVSKEELSDDPEGGVGGILVSEGLLLPITLEQVRAKLAALSQAGKQAQVKGLITKFGAVKLTDIPEAKYPELLAAAKKIEQEIATDKVKQKMEGTA